ncbi:MAG: hypothetical protein CME59_13825 [Halioglobus sp.]|nr:hypothetical protein [Halioglobus sp.]
MFKKTAIAAAVGLTLSVGAQADYRWQLDGQAGRTNIDVGRDDGDVDQFGIGGRFYFDDVDTGNGPLGEAAFLDHASYVGAGYVYTDLDDIVDDLDGDTYEINARYVLPLDSIPLIFEGAWTRETPEFSDIDYFRIGFGAYLTDTTTVVLSYRTSDVDESDEVDAGDIDAYELAVEHLWHLDGDAAIKVEGSYGLIDVGDNDVNDGDDIDSWNIGGTWYINRNLGFGLAYSRFDNFGIEEDTYGVSAEWFVNEDIGLSLGYAHSEVDDTDVESDAVVLGAELRF